MMKRWYGRSPCPLPISMEWIEFNVLVLDNVNVILGQPGFVCDTKACVVIMYLFWVLLLWIWLWENTLDLVFGPNTHTRARAHSPKTAYTISRLSSTVGCLEYGKHNVRIVVVVVVCICACHHKHGYLWSIIWSGLSGSITDRTYEWQNRARCGPRWVQLCTQTITMPLYLFEFAFKVR